MHNIRVPEVAALAVLLRRAAFHGATRLVTTWLT